MDSGGILNKDLSFIGGIEIGRQVKHTLDEPNAADEADETLFKYKANERELKREKRTQQQQRDREAKYQKKLEEWLEREVSRNKQKEREAQRMIRDVDVLIQRDLEYDS